MISKLDSSNNGECLKCFLELRQFTYSICGQKIKNLISFKIESTFEK